MDESSASAFEFLGLRFHTLTMRQSIDQVEKFIASKSPHVIFTPTAELLVRASEDPALREICNSADLLTVDSYVVCYAARIFGKQAVEPVSGARLMFEFLKLAKGKKYRLYLLGAAEAVVRKTADNLKQRYPGINIVGLHNGYFDIDQEARIVSDIKQSKPDVLFVGMSSPLKENFISRNFTELNVPASIGVGGSFDIIAGKCTLAPEWISRIGLEWFYRLIQEPRRLWKRYLVTNTKFMFLLLRELFRRF